MTTTEANAAIAECTRCGKETPAHRARPYWHRARSTHGEWEREELCPTCARNASPPEYTPELDF